MKRPKLSIPGRLAIAVFAVGGISSCGGPSEPACAYLCNSDAAVEIANSDASPDPQHENGFTTDAGESCHVTFC